MIELLGEELHKYLLKTAKTFAEFCNENDLTFYLSGGTLLGAVRHHGFIPWDDDMDMMMPRNDYEKMLSLKFDDGRYKIIDCVSDKNYGYPFAKIIDTKTYRTAVDDNQTDFGIYIDIFPIDGYPDNEFVSRMRNYYLRYLRRWRNFMLISKTPRENRFWRLKNIVRAINPITPNEYARRINRIGKKKRFEDSSFVGVQSGTHVQNNERNPKMIFEKTIYMTFEDTSFPCPSGYDIYLTHLYGDYMTPPSEDKRDDRHTSRFYLIDE